MPAFSSGPLGPKYAKFDFAAVYGRAWVCRANTPGAYSDGRPKGLPYSISEGFLENRRGGAEGEPAEGREKPPWGVPLRKQRGRDQIRRRGGPCGRLYSRCESWRAHAMRPYWFPVDCRGGPVWPPASEISASCRTRSPGHAVPPMAGRPRGSPLRVKQNISGRAGEGTSPYGESRTVAVGSAEPGAEQGPQLRQFLQTQGPVARMEPQKAAQILRAGNFAPPRRYAPPVMGVLGDGRHGGRNGAAVSADCARPLAVLW